MVAYRFQILHGYELSTHSFAVRDLSTHVAVGS